MAGLPYGVVNAAMAKKSSKLTAKGADTAQELYVLIGAALSWWESSEDMILGIFRQLCDDIEPVAVASFIRANRSTRYSMLKIAIETYHFRFDEGETATVSKSLRELAKLASGRNEIAHGNVASYSAKDGDAVVAEGNYLMPSFNEGEYHERSFRYHHTPQTIEAFVTQLRHWRGHIMDVWGAMVNRTQGRINGVGNGQLFVQTARRISRLEVFGMDAVSEMKEIIGHIDHWNAR